MGEAPQTSADIGPSLAGGVDRTHPVDADDVGDAEGVVGVLVIDGDTWVLAHAASVKATRITAMRWGLRRVILRAWMKTRGAQG